jgi:outer membrane protein
MKTILAHLICLLGFTLVAHAQTELTFTSLDSVFSYADKSSSVIKTNRQQTLLAKYQKIAALANVVNLKNQVGFTLTDNTTLPVSFFPGGIFPGTNPGTFEKVTLGQQYVSNFNLTPQIDLINPGTWAQIKTANINEELTSVNNLINKKTLHESIAACYFNICSYYEQVDVTQKNLAATDTLLQIISSKFSQGQVRQQDVNDATINKLSLQDKLNQLKISLEQQYNSLKILCDIPLGTKVSIADKLNYDQQFVADMDAGSQLIVKSNILQAQYAKSDLRTNRLSNLPVISLFYSHSNYQNSVNQFFDNNPNNKWLSSAYLGAKITFLLPDVNHLLSSRNAKITYQTAMVNLNHNQLQNDISNNQLHLDYEKAYSQFYANKQIFQLKEENYKMSYNQYNQSILSFNSLLLTFNDMLISRLNYCNSLANLLYTKSKIDINNNIK